VTITQDCLTDGGEVINFERPVKSMKEPYTMSCSQDDIIDKDKVNETEKVSACPPTETIICQMCSGNGKLTNSWGFRRIECHVCQGSKNVTVLDESAIEEINGLVHMRRLGI